MLNKKNCKQILYKQGECFLWVLSNTTHTQYLLHKRFFNCKNQNEKSSLMINLFIVIQCSFHFSFYLLNLFSTKPFAFNVIKLVIRAGFDPPNVRVISQMSLDRTGMELNVILAEIMSSWWWWWWWRCWWRRRWQWGWDQMWLERTGIELNVIWAEDEKEEDNFQDDGEDDSYAVGSQMNSRESKVTAPRSHRFQPLRQEPETVQQHYCRTIYWYFCWVWEIVNRKQPEY